MRILLLGEYSNVHWTLAEGLRHHGHEVVVVSDGDGWKNYPRNISLHRTSNRLLPTLAFLARLMRALPKLRGYDVVQIINPVFVHLKAEKLLPIYRYLRRHNKKVFMGAFGVDYFWVKCGLDGHTFRYSDFNIGKQLRHNADNDREIADWLNGAKGKLNLQIAADCDGIVSGLYEYDACYRRSFPEKTKFIPFPIDVQSITPKVRSCDDGRVNFFIGIQKKRNEYKGTDIMLRSLQRLQAEYPDRVQIEKAESVPFAVYRQMMDDSHVILDQLYSYTPAMNALQAMAQGLVVVGGGEPENYEILHETELRPIINVLPDEEDVYRRLKELALHPEKLARLSADSRRYVERHHDHIKVAQEYLDFWASK